MIISLNEKELFKVFYQIVGNCFVIQIKKLDETINYKRIDAKLHIKSRNVYVYNNTIIKNDNSDVPSSDSLARKILILKKTALKWARQRVFDIFHKTAVSVSPACHAYLTSLP